MASLTQSDIPFNPLQILRNRKVRDQTGLPLISTTYAASQHSAASTDLHLSETGTPHSTSRRLSRVNTHSRQQSRIVENLTLNLEDDIKVNKNWAILPEEYLHDTNWRKQYPHLLVNHNNDPLFPELVEQEQKEYHSSEQSIASREQIRPPSPLSHETESFLSLKTKEDSKKTPAHSVYDVPSFALEPLLRIRSPSPGKRPTFDRVQSSNEPNKAGLRRKLFHRQESGVSTLRQAKPTETPEFPIKMKPTLNRSVPDISMPSTLSNPDTLQPLLTRKSTSNSLTKINTGQSVKENLTPSTPTKPVVTRTLASSETIAASRRRQAHLEVASLATAILSQQLLNSIRPLSPSSNNHKERQSTYLIRRHELLYSTIPRIQDDISRKVSSDIPKAWSSLERVAFDLQNKANEVNDELVQVLNGEVDRTAALLFDVSSSQTSTLVLKSKSITEELSSLEYAMSGAQTRDLLFKWLYLLIEWFVGGALFVVWTLAMVFKAFRFILLVLGALLRMTLLRDRA